VSIQDGLGSFVVMHPIEGSYSALLQDGYGTDGQMQKAWISQIGDVPGDATSIIYSTDKIFGSLVVSLNGTTIPMSLYSVGPVIDSNLGPVEMFIGDIRPFTGQQNVELRFTGTGPLDDIQFTPMVVPEPSTLVLLTLAVLGTFAHIMRRRRRVAGK
jgi:PEP-CTERM motif